MRLGWSETTKARRDALCRALRRLDALPATDDEFDPRYAVANTAVCEATELLRWWERFDIELRRPFWSAAKEV